jgi:hypothetical protein
MSVQKGPFGAPPKYAKRFLSINAITQRAIHRYINDFSKALAGEVKILLQEVGKLRDERRQLQQCVCKQHGCDPIDSLGLRHICSEISELMSVKAKYSVGGEYAPDWNPHVRLPMG